MQTYFALGLQINPFLYDILFIILQILTVHWCFLSIILFHILWIWILWKTGTYGKNLYIMSCFSCQLGHMRKKFLLCPAFLVSWDICEKSSYYVPYKCHNRTFVASSRPYVPLDFYRRTFLLSFCLYVPYRYHSRIF